MSNPNFERMLRTLRARHPLVLISTVEEVEASELVVSAALKLSRPIRRWSVMAGLVEGAFAEDHNYQHESAKPEVALHELREHGADDVIILNDLISHLESPVLLRGLREVLHQCQRHGSTIVLIDHSAELPAVLRQQALTFEVTLPDRKELERIAHKTVGSLHDANRTRARIKQSAFSQVIDTLRGLSRRQAKQLVSAVALEDGVFDASSVERLTTLKSELLYSDGLLEVVSTSKGLESLGGFNHFKTWIQKRHPARATADAPAARGALLLGVPGAGKSHSVRAVAHEWSLPLLRLDAGSLYDAFIGQSEQRLRNTLAQANAMAPCVLWIDEIEKAFASAASRSVDGGLSQRMFGYLLTWLQDHSAPVFTLATANDIQALPAELLRKGRFDQIFFVDLPDQAVRQQLLQIHGDAYGYIWTDNELEQLASACDGCTGAEIQQALLSAKIDHRDTSTERDETAKHGIDVDDDSQSHDQTTEHQSVDSPSVGAVIEAFSASPPLSVTMAEHIDALRQWSVGRCVPA